MDQADFQTPSAGFARHPHVINQRCRQAEIGYAAEDKGIGGERNKHPHLLGPSQPGNENVLNKTQENRTEIADPDGKFAID